MPLTQEELSRLMTVFQGLSEESDVPEEASSEASTQDQRSPIAPKAMKPSEVQKKKAKEGSNVAPSNNVVVKYDDKRHKIVVEFDPSVTPVRSTEGKMWLCSKGGWVNVNEIVDEDGNPMRVMLLAGFTAKQRAR